MHESLRNWKLTPRYFGIAGDVIAEGTGLGKALNIPGKYILKPFPLLRLLSVTLFISSLVLLANPTGTLNIFSYSYVVMVVLFICAKSLFNYSLQFIGEETSSL